METAIWASGVLLTVTVFAISFSSRIRKLSQRMDALERRRGLPSEFPTGEDRTAWQTLALDHTSKIQAIKAYREETGAGLAEAKQAVEKWLKTR